MKTTSYYTKNKEEVDKRYRKFKSLVNMSAKEMKAWKKEPCSKAASIKRLEVINRVTRLLEKPKVIWNRKDFIDSTKVISYLSRATAIKDSVKPASKLCRRGKNYYALKNWAFDRDKVKPRKRKNPSNLIEGSYEIKKQLKKLMNDGQIVALQFISTYQTFYGTLKYDLIVDDFFQFQYNPLNQHKFEVESNIQNLSANTEHWADVEFLEDEFKNNDGTFKFIIDIRDIAFIQADNEIWFKHHIKFKPTQI